MPAVRFLTFVFLTTSLIVFASQLHGQESAAPPPAADATRTTVSTLPPPKKVDVDPLAKDDDIARRLTSILNATEWFENPSTEVKQGVVFLYGQTLTQKYKDWATDLARNTQDVAAVVNRIEVRQSSLWDFSPLEAEITGMFRRGLLSLPYLILGMFILMTSILIARFSIRSSRRVLEGHYEAQLLRDVLAKSVGLLVFLIGLYFVLRIFGLTRLAVTVLGGTGLFGLVLGIAFRDITENFLASVLLSIQNPFRPGDLVQIGNDTGFVNRLNARTTVLMTLDGNSLQIPNSTVYKSTIINLMSNPNRRESFVISISYRDSIADAQSFAMAVLNEHPAVLDEPEPWVLVDSLTPEYVNLKVYYWINAKDHSSLKVKSSIIRLVKIAFQQHGIQLPAAPAAALAMGQLALLPPQTKLEPEKNSKQARREIRERSEVATEAEAGLGSEENQLLTQAKQARRPEDGQNLLTPPVSDEEQADEEHENPVTDKSAEPISEPALTR